MNDIERMRAKLAELGEKDRPDLARELTFPCSVCCARVGERCASLVDASKYLPLSHFRRRALAQAATVKEPHA